jgi:hypothetical protein
MESLRRVQKLALSEVYSLPKYFHPKCGEIRPPYQSVKKKTSNNVMLILLGSSRRYREGRF